MSLSFTLHLSRPLTPNHLLHLSCKLCMYLSTPLSPKYISFCYEGCLYYILERSQMLHCYHTFNLGMESILKHLYQKSFSGCKWEIKVERGKMLPILYHMHASLLQI